MKYTIAVLAACATALVSAIELRNSFAQTMDPAQDDCDYVHSRLDSRLLSENELY